MAILEILAYVLIDVPMLALRRVLRARFVTRSKRLEAVATFLFIALLTGACFLAWFVSERS